MYFSSGEFTYAVFLWTFVALIDPRPDTVIRIIMSYKGLEEPIEVTEQKLESVSRTGFTVVEWGGTEIE